MAQCVQEHDALIAEAGYAARTLVQHKGWIRCLRTEASFYKALANARRLDQYGVDYAVLGAGELQELEPHVSRSVIGAVHFRASPTSSDPGKLTKAYADLFTRKGGRFLGGEEFGDKGICGAGRKLFDRSLLDDPAFAHQNRPPAEEACFAKAMGNHDHSLAQVSEDVA